MVEEWPECINEDCDEEVNPKRVALGYHTCLKCGSPAPTRIVDTAFNKGGLQLISQDDLLSMGRKTQAD